MNIQMETNNKKIIEVKGIGKKYNINHQQGGYITLRDIITNAFKNPLSFLKRKTKNILGLETKEVFWALKDINFEVQKGEVIGIIGKNGAGKSTLLKILSQITPPTEGEIRINGTVGSLLEVGTGFHPELTGRENIFLNGAILGMKKKEIVKKFNEIVKFADIEKFLDTPVKYYSSGMYVRLAFSVAAHMDTDILIIDEVLAVGDAEFQKKCLNKMNDITKEEGRTILFVSHDMGAIKQLCNNCILLSGGKIDKIGNTNSVIDYYLNNNQNFSSLYEYKKDINRTTNITKIFITDENNINTSRISINKDLFVNIEYEFNNQEDGVLLSLFVYKEGELFLLSSESDSSNKLENYKPGKYTTIIKIPSYLLNIGLYELEISLHRPYVEYLDRKQNLILEILDIDNIKSKIFKGQSLGKTGAILDYQTTNI